MEDVLQLLRLSWTPSYRYIANWHRNNYMNEYEMAFAGARASRSSALDKVVASSIANVSIDRAGLLLITDNE
jgi:hypothetical protein